MLQNFLLFFSILFWALSPSYAGKSYAVKESVVWDIKFDSVSTIVLENNSMSTLKEPNIVQNSINYSMRLNKATGYGQFIFNIKNNGNIDVKVKEIVVTGIEGYEDNVNVKVDNLRIGDVIKSKTDLNNIPSDIPMKYSYKGDTSYHNSNSKYNSVVLPSTTQTVQANFLRHDLKYTSNTWYYDMYDFVVTCKAEVPPTLKTINSRVYTYTNCTLYVPYDSVELYEEHSYWGQFNVLPIE